MNLVAVYILREKTRPTESEGYMYITSVLKQYYEGNLEKVCQLLDFDMKQIPLVISSIMEEGYHVEKVMVEFVRSAGGDKYFQQPDKYKLFSKFFKSGDPSEETGMIFIFTIEEDSNRNSLSDEAGIINFLKRGQRWENMSRWYDAIQCYTIGLEVNERSHELLYRLGIAYMNVTDHLGDASKALKKAYDLQPGRKDYAEKLADCYIVISELDVVEVYGVTKQNLLDNAIILLERALALEPDNHVIKEKLSKIKPINEEDEDIFFGK